IVPVAAAGTTDAVSDTACPKGPGAGPGIVVVVVNLTTRETAGEVEPAKFPSPLKTAGIEGVPPGRAAGLRLAAPALTGAVPNTVLPSRNCTLPVAVLGEIAALKITACPATEGLSDEVKAAVVDALPTVMDIVPAEGR